MKFQMFAEHRSTSESNTKIQGVTYFSNYLSVQISSSMWIYTEGAPSSSSRLLQHHSCSEQQGKRRLPTAGWIWWPQVTKIISERLMFLFKQGPACCCCWSCQICSCAKATHARPAVLTCLTSPWNPLETCFSMPPCCPMTLLSIPA